ncbi:hypothetical protein [Streptomyces mirabilis]|uniref:hypothetical protein n=1 Tax=Streptomyces mirabilis TaxID=68239 RepID=UPI00369C1D08
MGGEAFDAGADVGAYDAHVQVLARDIVHRPVLVPLSGQGGAGIAPLVVTTMSLAATVCSVRCRAVRPVSSMPTSAITCTTSGLTPSPGSGPAR